MKIGLIKDNKAELHISGLSTDCKRWKMIATISWSVKEFFSLNVVLYDAGIENWCHVLITITGL